MTLPELDEARVTLTVSGWEYSSRSTGFIRTTTSSHSSVDMSSYTDAVHRLHKDHKPLSPGIPLLLAFV